MAIQPGTDIGRYHILEQLGEGGMAVVYKAYDTHLENEVAVKIIRLEDLPAKNVDRTLKRFQLEAKKMAKLTHPNIVPVIDYGEYQGSPYLVMRYLPGGTLKGKLGKPMPWQDAVRLLKPIADAAAYAHSKSLIHRDIKPSNILIAETGEPMLTDFGIAKILSNEETLDLTVTGMGVGTPEYMAPEQAEGKEIDERADVYSLGIVLYELVTGRKPFSADTPLAVIVKQLHDPLPKPTLLNPDLPEQIERMLFKALAKNPNDRYADMDVFAAALENLAAHKKPDAGKRPARTRQADRIVPQEKSEREKPAHPTEEKKPFDTRWLIGLMGIVGLSLVIFAGIKLFVDEEESPLVVAQEAESVIETPNAAATNTPAYTTTPALGVVLSMVSEKDGMTLVYVPEGEFEMGSEDGDNDERPEHTVYLDAYWIDQTEVTNDMFANFLKEMGNQKEGRRNWFDSASRYALISKPDDQWWADSGYGDHPVMEVTWYGANAYCEWAGRRLPTEAEWEKAARGTDSRTYPWGEGISCSQVNYRGCDEFPTTSPVGHYGDVGASPYGAYDMAGNLWEWVSDWYGSDYYEESPAENPAGLNSGSYRVTRGGSWYIYEGFTRSANRYYFPPGNSYFDIGFRCALSP